MIFSLTVVANLLLGIALLAFGRKLFWLFVGAAGFLTGIEIAAYFQAGNASTKFLIALAAGLLGIFLAIVFYKLAVALAGFAIGGYLAINIVHYLSIAPQPWDWAIYIFGGILGAILILFLLDWTLIVFSSMAGASLIVHSFPVRYFAPLLFIVLTAIGIFVQARTKLHS
jgi:hypothetical protein